jgi:hypothetical protein
LGEPRETLASTELQRLVEAKVCCGTGPAQVRFDEAGGWQDVNVDGHTLFQPVSKHGGATPNEQLGRILEGLIQLLEDLSQLGCVHLKSRLSRL